MELKKILAGIEGLKVRGSLDINISNIESDSRKIKKDGLFVAIKGFDTDGHKYMKKAIENGAKVIVASLDGDKKLLKEIMNDVTLVLAPDSRLALAICACNFYEDPSKKVKLIGITGTKGKTTTSFMLKSILEKQGKKVGLIGTIATYIGNTKIEDSDRTTPESLKLQQILSEMVKQKCEVVIMEVSSQSLKLHRVTGCDFDIGVITNFSQDHISNKEHSDMEDYFNSKLKLFDMCRLGFANADDLYTAKVPSLIENCQILTYGIDNYCNLLAKDITVTNYSVDFKVKLGDRNERVKVGIPGRFSVYNSLAAIYVALKLGCSAESIKEALEIVKVPGRSELVENPRNLNIMIDYAHSPESLENILKAVKSYTRGEVICIFGCGGDRDSSKREIMGEVAGRLADYTIITSDNPRTEEPKKITQQIEKGIKKTKGKYICIVDRIKAIEYGLKRVNKNDIIVLAGKGHEPYQEINGVKYDFNEHKIVNDILNEENLKEKNIRDIKEKSKIKKEAAKKVIEKDVKTEQKEIKPEKVKKEVVKKVIKKDENSEQKEIKPEKAKKEVVKKDEKTKEKEVKPEKVKKEAAKKVLERDKKTVNRKKVTIKKSKESEKAKTIPKAAKKGEKKPEPTIENIKRKISKK